MKYLVFLLSCPVLTFAADFVNGQAARAVIGQPTFTAQNAADSTQTPPIPVSASLLGAVSGLAYANGSLFVSDANHLQATPVQNRVLIFDGINSKQIPAPDAELITTGVRCPVCTGTANVVLGQANFTGVGEGLSATGLRTPTGISTDGRILAVADTDNNRVLIWNSIPATNDAPANVVLGQKDFTSLQPATTVNASALRGPQGVWIQGHQLFVADTFNNRILIWNSIPTQNGQAADLVLGQADLNSAPASPAASSHTMNTPVSVTSDGVHLFVADLGNNRLLIWNSIPAQNGQPADVVVGQPDFTSSLNDNVAPLCPSTKDSSGNPVYPGMCAATLDFPRYALSDGTRLFVADSGNDRVLIFPTVPTQNGARGKFVLGQPDEYEDVNDQGSFTDPGSAFRSSSGTMRTPQALAWDGANLYVSDPYDRRVMVFTPEENLVPQSGIANAASLAVYALGAIAIGGTIHTGDIITVIIGGATSATYTYTVTKTDTLATVTANLAAAISSSNSRAGDPNVTVEINVSIDEVVLIAKTPGVAGDNVTYSATVSSGALITATAAGANLAGGQSAAQIAPGTLITVFGSGGFTDGSPAAAPAGNTLPRKLGTVELYVDGMRAPLMYVSNKQINGQMPFEVTKSTSVSVWVRSVFTDGTVHVSAPVDVSIIEQTPGVFAASGKEPRAAIAEHSTSFGTAVVSVDGTVKAGDTGTIKIGSNSYTYTVLSTDTLATIRDALVKLIDASASEQVVASAATSFTRVILTAKKKGSAGEGITVSATQSTGASLLLTVLGAGVTCCGNAGPSPLITQTNPAVPGEIIYLYATGLGMSATVTFSTPEGPTGTAYVGPPTEPNATVDALVNGNSTANVLGATLMPGAIGIYQVTLQLDSALTTNSAAQLRIAQGIYTSNIVTIPVKKP